MGAATAGGCRPWPLAVPLGGWGLLLGRSVAPTSSPRCVGEAIQIPPPFMNTVKGKINDAAGATDNVPTIRLGWWQVECHNIAVATTQSQE